MKASDLRAGNAIEIKQGESWFFIRPMTLEGLAAIENVEKFTTYENAFD